MAEYDKNRYYWIKLTDRFMTSDTVDFLMSQKDGANYVVLYQMLCLKTVNNNGIMARTLGEMIVPYDIDKIQRDCKWFPIDTVRVALGLYKKLGLIYENKDGILAISNFSRMIGSQTYGAEKKELQKERGGTKVEKIPPEIEIKRKRTDIENNNIRSIVHSLLEEAERYVDEKAENAVYFNGKTSKAVEDYKNYIRDSLKQKYVDSEGLVFMNDRQLEFLQDRYSEEELDKYFKIIADCENSGKHFTKKSHFVAIIEMAETDRRMQGCENLEGAL